MSELPRMDCESDKPRERLHDLALLVHPWNLLLGVRVLPVPVLYVKLQRRQPRLPKLWKAIRHIQAYVTLRCCSERKPTDSTSLTPTYRYVSPYPRIFPRLLAAHSTISFKSETR